MSGGRVGDASITTDDAGTQAPGQQHEFTKADTEHWLHARRNWGRWGDDDEIGAINLITPEKRVRAASLVRSGISFSLSRPFPTQPAPTNARPALHYMERHDRSPEGAGDCGDYYGVAYHGTNSTHIDAICHLWDGKGIYNGRQPDDVVGFSGASFGAIDGWRDGIVTRGVLLDVPGFRGTDYVTQDRPVHGWELQALCEAKNIRVEPGDAIVVYSGREKYGRGEGRPWGSGARSTENQIGPDRPGLHASCLQFIRETDVSLLAWDMMDMYPYGVDLTWTVHGAIFAFGVALVDNCLLESFADACGELDRTDFMFVAAPLRVEGGTGSPLNPIAVL
jgi:kynurenine formamidase